MLWDVIVIGGGHAGCEAAAAAARMGANTALVTMVPSMIGAMSCNPAIGGIGKGHLVREVDAFDGLMARAADRAAIHYRMLNSSKGAAVQGPRIQADRKLFRGAIQEMVASQNRLTVIEGEVGRLSICNGKIIGCSLADGQSLTAQAVVIASGTFLGGRLHCGLDASIGGRIGERAATELAAQLRDLGMPIARLKTGTPPRLDGRTIDWSKLDRQSSDREPWTFSPMGRRAAPQIACAITRTNSRTHDIICKNLSLSPLHSGAIEGRGPRYCPSIEDKVHRFGDREGHQIFLEPEGIDDPTVYPNGISTSLPASVQQKMMRSIAGLERVEIVQPGYAVEYDHIDPRALDAALSLKATAGLYFAGQVNGTTGYEEAAAQGLVAGINAARHVAGQSPHIFARSDSYIGVMIDDLTLQGVTEPYRMLTARAEYRLRLRSDNAATRLGAIACALNVVSPERRHWFERRDALLQTALAIGSEAAGELGFDPDLIAEVAQDKAYAPYLARQEAEIARLQREEGMPLTNIADYSAIPGLSSEMVERLNLVRPATLAAAGRMRGITPAALTAILVHSHRRAA